MIGTEFNEPRYVERQPVTPEDFEIVAAVRAALLRDGDDPDEWGNGLGMECLNPQSPFDTPEEEAEAIAWMVKTEAALEFLPDGAPISYDVGTNGLLFED